MNEPILISAPNFQGAWANAVIMLKENGWEIWNLVVQIADPSAINRQYHKEVTAFARANALIPPDQVAYTIIPFHSRYLNCGRENFYKMAQKYFRLVKRRKPQVWGSYFERMIDYCPSGDKSKRFDQLGNIIDSINSRPKNYGASYFMVIPYPEKQAKLTMGAPCLNYVTVQVEKSLNAMKTVNLLAVYRNHDFLRRTYGNYYGLCKLLEYIASETNSNLGVVTCVSSHAFIGKSRAGLHQLSLRYEEYANA